jgi:hypothetical protein
MLDLYEIPLGRYSEQIERRTSNAQHRTSNNDDATLYRFYKKRTTESSKGGQVSNDESLMSLAEAQALHPYEPEATLCHFK